jgi:hypothetical protein
VKPYLWRNSWIALSFQAGSAALWSQHGVIREYAALAPKPTAVPLRPLVAEPLTDASIALGPDGNYFMTGSAVESGAAALSREVPIWRSADMKQWRKIRTLNAGPRAVRSPEIHSYGGRFWMTLGVEGGGTELLRFESGDLAQSGFKRARITDRGEDPSLFLDDDGTFYWVMGAGEWTLRDLGSS